MGALDIIMIVVDILLLGQRMKNVYHAAPAGAVIDDEGIDDLMSWLVSAYAEILPIMADNLNMQSITIRNISDDGDLGVHDWAGAATGSATGEILPLGVAGLVTFPTQTIGSRGRKFIPGFTETSMGDSAFVAGAVTDMAQYGVQVATPFVGDVSGVVWQPGVVDASGGFFRPFNGEVLTTSIPAYQRRRKQGVGE